MLSAGQAQELQGFYDLYWSVQAAIRLLSAKTRKEGVTSEGGVAFLCRSTQTEGLEELHARLEEAYARADIIIEKAIRTGTEA